MTSLSRRAPRVACSLIRRTFRSPVVSPDLCHMQWHGASRSTLLLLRRVPMARPYFLPLSASRLSRPYTNQGRFDAPFSHNELVDALSKCHSLKSHSHGWGPKSRTFLLNLRLERAARAHSGGGTLGPRTQVSLEVRRGEEEGGRHLMPCDPSAQYK